MNISAGLLIVKDNKILLVKQTVSGDSIYSIPKGCMMQSETLIDAAIRETHEESGIQIVKSDISAGPYLINYVNDKGVLFKQVFYFVVRLTRSINNPTPIDTEEIESACFFNVEEACTVIHWRQRCLLQHVDKKHIDKVELEMLLNKEYITKEKHPTQDLFIYNYTEKCKKEQYWNETTLWCRGLILNSKYEIIARPLKKFFEPEQLYPQVIPIEKPIRISEKMDGALGILYWINGLPRITTRNSFTTAHAYKGTFLLYNKYAHAIPLLNERYSYFFEIIYPQSKVVVDYGYIEDIFLLDAIDNVSGEEIDGEDLQKLPFPKANNICNNLTIDELRDLNIVNQEGYVAKYNNHFRLKLKFDNYKQKHWRFKHEK
ncbi:MAG: NUDIX domain-containing protein [Prevotellaceae bacterium]|jgi:ADP-ribose pyrophosphatase YjhB (NUDIX family)|nr:NUDIX domain-containing protein [Prevotellaceae bacterium]